MSTHSPPALLSTVALQTPHCPRWDFGDRATSLSIVAAPPGGILAAEGFSQTCSATLPCHSGHPCAPYLVLLQACPQHPAPSSSPACTGCSGLLLSCPYHQSRVGITPCEGCERETGKKTHITSGHLAPGQPPISSSLGLLGLEAERIARKS